MKSLTRYLWFKIDHCTIDPQIVDYEILSAKTCLNAKKYPLQYHTTLSIAKILTKHEHLISVNY